MNKTNYSNKHRFSLLMGLVFSGLLALVCIWLTQLPGFRPLGLSTLTIAIVIGIILGNTVYSRVSHLCSDGIQFAKQKLLRLGIILYGFNLTFQDVLNVGLAGIIIDALIILTTFLIALFVGKKVLAMDEQTSIMIGSGASICGAAAVMATEPIVKAESGKVTVAVATVVIFGTIAMFLYPWLYQLNLLHEFVTFEASQFGVYLGSTVHEVAQVVAAGRAINDDVSNAAVITKMIRVMMLAPFLIILSAWFSRRAVTNQQAKQKVIIPWFAVLFILVTTFNSLQLLPGYLINVLKWIDILLLAMAMASLGLTTHISAFKQAGIKPLLLAATLFTWLIFGGLFINYLVNYLLN